MVRALCPAHAGPHRAAAAAADSASLKSSVALRCSSSSGAPPTYRAQPAPSRSSRHGSAPARPGTISTVRQRHLRHGLSIARRSTTTPTASRRRARLHPGPWPIGFVKPPSDAHIRAAVGRGQGDAAAGTASGGGMKVGGKRCLVCDCEGTMPLDGAALARALGSAAEPVVHHQLCRRQIDAVGAAAAGGEALLIACTQEAPLFAETLGGGRPGAVLRQHPRARRLVRRRRPSDPEDRGAPRRGSRAGRPGDHRDAPCPRAAASCSATARWRWARPVSSPAG